MAEGSAALHTPGPPLTQRLAETPPWSPLRLALAIAAALLALFLGIEAAFGRFAILLGEGRSEWDLEAQVNFRIAIVMILLAAYLPAAYAAGVRGARRTVRELRPFLRAGDDAVQLAASAGRFDRNRLRRAGLIGIAFSVVIPFWTDRELAAWAIWKFAPEPIVQRFLLPVVGWFAGRFFYSVWAEARRLSAIGRDHVRVDLLDLRSFAPLTSQGLRYALLVVGVISILAIYLYDSDKPGLISIVLTASAVALAAAATALLLPVRGARQAIVAAKRHELDWCDAELRRARAALESGPAAPGAVSDLVAWRSTVQAVQEWPLDAPTLRRFVLYLAIPLGSWLGGAIVERIVDLVL